MKTRITIDGANGAGSNYIAWSPVHSSIRLTEADGATSPVAIVLRNQNPNSGGQIVFSNTVGGTFGDQLALNLPANGAPVDFFIAGKFEKPSVADKDAVIRVVRPNNSTTLETKSLMVRIRKNANRLITAERDRFLKALEALNKGTPNRFKELRMIHAEGMDDEAHGFAGFLPWHRAYMLDVERELQRIDASVALPYWKFDEPAPKLFSRDFIGFAPMSDTSGNVQFSSTNPLLNWPADTKVGVDRRPYFNTSTSAAVAPARSGFPRTPVLTEAATLRLGGTGKRYARFRELMEFNPHAVAHGSFSGFIAFVPTAAQDPLFFLLHANIDRLWAKWQLGDRQVGNLRFDSTSTATYEFLSRPGDLCPGRVGHNLNDTMWPWNQNRGTGGLCDRPRNAPGGTFPPSPAVSAPGLSPRVRDMIDYQGLLAPANCLGFGYDDVPFK